MDRDDDGQFTATVEDENVVAAIAQLSQPVLTTDVADELDLTRQAADYRLRRLREADRVSSGRVGAALIWDTVGDEEASAGSAQTPESADTDIREGRSDPLEPQGATAKPHAPSRATAPAATTTSSRTFGASWRTSLPTPSTVRPV